VATALQREAEDGGTPKLPQAGSHALTLERGRPIDRGLSDPKVEETHGYLGPRQAAQGGADHWVGGETAALNVVRNERQIGGKSIGEVNHLAHDFHCSVRAHVGDISGDIVDIRS
jgi:hypothetical protein